MTVKRMQLKQWQRLNEAGDPIVQDLSSGRSPGGAAAELGITRQAVHKAIKRGSLDALAVYDGTKLRFYTISHASLQRYRSRLRVIAQAQERAAANPG